jgi:hypothetical protein
MALVIAMGLVAGLPFPPDDQLWRFPSFYARLVPGLRRAQELVVAPFRPVRDALVLTQRWNLFSSAKTRRYWLSLEGRDAKTGKYALLYRPHDPVHAADGDVLEYRRVRGAWNPRSDAPRAGYAAFVTFEARRLLLVHPELDAIRARFEAIDVLPRGRGFHPTGRRVFELVRERREVLP